jgi:predicted GNAT family N-acyltransferase
MSIEVVPVQAAEQLEEAFAIRRTVFVDEQGVSEAIEIDGLDDQAEHLLAIIEDRPVGTLRMRLFDQGRMAKIERVAVLAPARGRQVGQALMHAVLAQARARGAAEAKVHAQTVVQDFYTRLGFVAVGSEFEEDGIAHIAMIFSLVEAAP